MRDARSGRLSKPDQGECGGRWPVGNIFGDAASVESVDVDSGAAEQPWGDDETPLDAETRARSCLSLASADIGVGIEAGLVELVDGTIESCSWVVAVGGSEGSAEIRRGQSRAASYLLPVELAELVRSPGVTLREATRQVFTREPIGSGTVGPLTAGRFDRRTHYLEAVMLALIPFYPSNSVLTFAR